MYVKCKACDGKGYSIPDGPGGWIVKLSCGVCSGNGGFHIPDDKELCPKCNGNGKRTVIRGAWPGVAVEVDCDNCCGEGYVDKK